MAKTASITVRLDPNIKSMAEQIYSDFGITISDAINIFLHKSIQLGGLPFSMRQIHPIRRITFFYAPSSI